MSTRKIMGVAAAALMVSVSSLPAAHAAPIAQAESYSISIDGKDARFETAKVVRAATGVAQLQKALADAQAKLANAGKSVTQVEKSVAELKAKLAAAQGEYDKAVAAHKAAKDAADKLRKALDLKGRGQALQIRFQKAERAKKAADEAFIKYQDAVKAKATTPDAGNPEVLLKQFEVLKKAAEAAGDPDKLFGELKTINEELRQLGGLSSQELKAKADELEKAARLAGDVKILGGKVDALNKPLSDAQKQLTQAKADEASARKAVQEATARLEAVKTAPGKAQPGPKPAPAPKAEKPAPSKPMPAPAQPAPGPTPKLKAPKSVPSMKAPAAPHYGTDATPATKNVLANTGASADSSIALALASAFAGLGLVAAARHNPRHRRGM
ncbi:hypothetical protein [Trueperella pecoris]|uniref:Uncharacterized protein n=1 Tax=Trueperella pecoris TaxID=2733571 RepID=A0A7M1QW09_9ACTO|nr:hypothetical protein [Trueperella pecoris]QOR46199.1 hypothetical protein INS88_03045 [Trueperella pecoris]